LGSPILKLHNTASAIFICPKVDVVGFSKTKESFNSRIYLLFFSGNIHKGTCEKEEERIEAQGEAPKI
jgi:hypothetical protein